MVLFCIVGELGAGKTLALTYLAYTNWKKGQHIFSNYMLYGFPFTLVHTIPNLDRMKEGFFAGDELWLWLETLPVTSKGEEKKIKNNLVSNILLKSRKRNLTLAYTSQTLMQVKSRIRDVNDFVAYPLMNANEDVCKVTIFRGSKPNLSSVMKGSEIYFHTEPVFSMYNTYEEINPLVADDSEEYEEVFLPVSENPGWIRRLEKLGYPQKDIEKVCKETQGLIQEGAY